MIPFTLTESLDVVAATLTLAFLAKLLLSQIAPQIFSPEALFGRIDVKRSLLNQHVASR